MFKLTPCLKDFKICLKLNFFIEFQEALSLYYRVSHCVFSTFTSNLWYTERR